MKTQFKLIENEHTPMADYEVVQFARDSDIGFKTKVPELKVVQGWLFSKGYDEKKNFISPEDLTSLKTVITHYYGTLGPFDYTMNFSDLFNIVGENQSGAYWLNRRGKHSQYVAPTRRTLEAIAELELIYPTTPDNFYFEITNDCLYIKYQSILGSRKLASLRT